MTDEPKLFNSNNVNDKVSDYGAVIFNRKILASTIDPGQDRLNQLGYKQVKLPTQLQAYQRLIHISIIRNFKEDYLHLPHLVCNIIKAFLKLVLSSNHHFSSSY
jgi:hypothetical protein